MCFNQKKVEFEHFCLHLIDEDLVTWPCLSTRRLRTESSSWLPMCLEKFRGTESNVKQKKLRLLSTIRNFHRRQATLNFPGTQVSSILWLFHCHHMASISSSSKSEWFSAIMATFLPAGNEKSEMAHSFLLKACPESCKYYSLSQSPEPSCKRGWRCNLLTGQKKNRYWKAIQFMSKNEEKDNHNQASGEKTWVG